MRKGMLKEGMLEQDVLKEGLLNMARLAIPTCKWSRVPGALL